MADHSLGTAWRSVDNAPVIKGAYGTVLRLFSTVNHRRWRILDVLILLACLVLGGWAIQFWFLPTHLIQTFRIGQYVSAVAISPNQQTIVAAGMNRNKTHPQVAIWETRTHRLQHVLPQTCYASALAIDPTSQILSVATGDGAVTLWDLTSGTQIRQLIPPQPWDAPLDKCHSINMSDGRDIYKLTFHPQGHLLAIAGMSGVRLIALDTGASVADLTGYHRYPENPDGLGAPVWDVAFSPDGDLLASVGSDSTAHIWFVPEGRLMQVISPPELRGNAYRVRFCAHAPCVIIAWDLPQTIETWSVDTGQRMAQMNPRQPQTSGRSRAFSPDGTLVARSYVPDNVGFPLFVDMRMYIYTLDPLHERAILRGHRDVVTAMTFSQDGSRLVSGSKNGTVRLWRLAE